MPPPGFGSGAPPGFDYPQPAGGSPLEGDLDLPPGFSPESPAALRTPPGFSRRPAAANEAKVGACLPAWHCSVAPELALALRLLL